MLALYDQICLACSRLITQNYSTSFSLGIRIFHPSLRPPIYAIYGFVRFADEIVDTFHDHNKAELLERFSKDTFQALEEGISLNPVLHAFQKCVRRYNIEPELIVAFLSSMEMDLKPRDYDQAAYEKYIYGSAEVIGLMCLRVFVDGDIEAYEQLKDTARSLGKGFQKVNFLRDMRSDHEERGRVYFPGVDFSSFTKEEKTSIEEDIAKDFAHAYQGIKQLPKSARMGVYLAFLYYKKLFLKIRSSSVHRVQNERIRVNNGRKFWLLAGTLVRNQLNRI